jgi:hypothetical protein
VTKSTCEEVVFLLLVTLSLLPNTHFELRSNVTSANVPVTLNLNNISQMENAYLPLHYPLQFWRHPHQQISPLICQSSVTAPVHHQQNFSGGLRPLPIVPGEPISAHCGSESLGAPPTPLGITAAVTMDFIFFWISFRVFHYTFQSKCLSIGCKVSPCKRTQKLFLFLSNN